MSTNSPLFDQIRVKPNRDRRLRADLPGCQWPGCAEPATHRAPKGRLRASEYWQFCLAHVREYNNSYNFFAGMSDDAVAQYQKEAITGHRPTWKMGSLVRKRAAKRSRGAFRGFEGPADEAFSLIGILGAQGAGHGKAASHG